MAHNLNYNAEKQQHSFFSVKEKAWHGLGQIIEHYPTSAEALEFAGLNFEVVKRPNEQPLPSGLRMISDNSFFTFRTDNEAVLGDRLGPDYTVVQNSDMFRFFDQIVGNGHGIRYETAGCLGKGETVFITAKLPDFIRVGRADCIEKYLFLTASHDGTNSITIAFTPVRIVCANTLNAALRDRTNCIKIRHTASASEKLRTAQEMLKISNDFSVELEAMFNRWSRVRISDPELKRLIQLAMAPNTETLGKLQLGQEAELSSHFNQVVSSVFDYAMTSPTQQEATTKGTLFGAYNAVTGYLQNVQNFKDGESKFKSIMYGKGLKQTQSAFDLCSRFAKYGNEVFNFN